jgi:superfamily II DNA or RNA helicase
MSSYFADHYGRVRLPIKTPGAEGLRRAQLGAIHAVASHFSLGDEPALVVMPTGSGKTAVLMLAAFVLRARRVLVVTPSVLVRYQIAKGFHSLATLRKTGALEGDYDGPRVREASEKAADADAWASLKEYDVVVGTPYSLSPEAGGVAAPPPDLFDLVLVDEAHHGRAKTWEALLAAFPDARQVHFTATPFRRDKRDLAGKLIFTYPLSQAYEDGVFGKIKFVPVTPAGLDPDVAIAKGAERAFNEDRAAGRKHLLMVRTDSRARADELARVYKENTALNLRRVHSGLAPSTVGKVVDALAGGELDGVICVDMLGEGFDLPTLKIAAVHAPHRSLAVTLQFIGRFARTESGDPIGDATFLAVPSDIEVERERLYEESAVWQEIVTNLSEGRIAQEVEARDQLGTFERVGDVQPDLADVSAHAFRPSKHVKIYRVGVPADDVDITSELVLPSGLDLIERWDSEELNAAVFVTQERTRPDWTRLEAFDRVEHDLFVVYHDRETNLLFINSTRRTTALYEALARSFTGGKHRILPLCKINNVLATLSDFRFPNVGMRRRALHPTADSYRISTGANAQQAVSLTDGAMYNRGHVFCIATNADGKPEHIGYSSASKVWCMEPVLVSKLIEWARVLAYRIDHFHDVKTNSGIDSLSLGVELTALPDGVIAVDWPADAYERPRRARHVPSGYEASLLDFDFEVDHGVCGGGVVRLVLSEGARRIELDCSITATGPTFTCAVGAAEEYVVPIGREAVPLIDYFVEHSPRLFRHDFSAIQDGQLFPTPTALDPFDASQIEPVDWNLKGVNVKAEFYEDGDVKSGPSVHEFLETELPALGEQVVFYDHGSGEMADYVTFTSSADGPVVIRFYHCKGFKGKKAGSAVGSAYEVAGQVVKSMVWVRRGPDELVAQARRRMHRGAKGSYFVCGDLQALKGVVSDGHKRGFAFELVLVQPGLSRAKLSPEVGAVLAAADDFIRGHNCDKLRIWGAA